MCWGLNHRGQCGVKGYMDKEPFTPVYPKIVPEPSYPKLAGNVTQIAAGPFSTAVLVNYNEGGRPNLSAGAHPPRRPRLRGRMDGGCCGWSVGSPVGTWIRTLHFQAAAP